MDYSIEIIGKETRRLHQQLYGVVYKPMRRIIAPILAVVALGYLILALGSGDSSYFALLITVVLLFLSAFLMHRWVGTLSYRKKLKYYNGAMPDSIVRFGEQIHLEDVDSSRTVPYDKIKTILLTADAIVLWLEDGKAIGLPKGPFTKGSLPELLQLLRENCPKAKLPNWL